MDGFLWKHVSFGLKATLGGGTYENHNTGYTRETGTYSQYNRISQIGLTLAPRVGVAFTSESGLGVWARAGLDVYFNAQTSTQRGSQVEGSYRYSKFDYGAAGDLLLTYSPLPHVVFMSGPYYQVRFVESGPSFRSFGLNVNAGIFL